MVDEMKINGVLINDSNKIAEEFNNYFSSVGETLAAKLPESQEHFSRFLGLRNEDDFRFNEVNEADLRETINNFKDCSPGVDEVPMKLLKYCINELIKPITHICNLSLHTGVFPKQWKHAIITPIFKAGFNDLVSNYRPISILSSFSKIIEKVASDQLYDFIEQSNELDQSQYGFRSGGSTEVALCDFVDDVLAAFDDEKYTVATFLDLSKAFDTVSHSILLAELEHFGVMGWSCSGSPII